jgi:4-amino-4-deoxy-L-arabinose transferase-like glycosyltransferase
MKNSPVSHRTFYLRMKPKFIIYVCIVAIVIRIAFAFNYYWDKEPEGWEYGAIAQNIIAGKGYSLFYFVNKQILTEYNSESKPLPSAYMMPGYVFVILPILYLFHSDFFLILLFQSIIAGFAVYLLFKFVSRVSDEKTGLLAAIIYSALPEFIYAASTIGPTVIFHFMVLVLLVRLHDNSFSLKEGFIVGVISSFLIYLRPETLLFVGLVVLYFLLKKRYRGVITAILVVLISLSPWVIRNILVFREFIPLTTSTGQNLYRGHNPYYNGFWMDERIHNKILNSPLDNSFEVSVNKVFLREVNNQIKNNPIREISSSLEKLGQLWIYNPNDNRSHNPFYLIPWIILMFFIFYEFFRRRNWNGYEHLILFVVSSTLISILFFVLPRYQTLMKIAVLPFAANSIIHIYRKLTNR